MSFWSFSFDHCIVCSYLIYSFWLPLWYLLTFDHCIVCSYLIYSFWLPLWYLLTFNHCIVCHLIYSFWLPLWYLQHFQNCILNNNCIFMKSISMFSLYVCNSRYFFVSFKIIYPWHTIINSIQLYTSLIHQDLMTILYHLQQYTNCVTWRHSFPLIFLWFIYQNVSNI